MRGILFTVLGFLSAAAWSEPDVPGSRDPLGLARFPHAWIVAYERDTEMLPREFVVSRVDKTRRDVRAERKVRAEADLESVTYRIPPGTPAAEVAAHYRRLLGADVLFSCGGRDCGRSNHWANYIFEQPILYGPDQNQSYLAVQHAGHLLGLYVIERGNKRVYAHLQVFRPGQPVAVAVNQVLTERLAGNGYVVVEGVTPLPNGTLPPSSRDVLAGLAPDLGIFAGHRVYVVCHLYGSQSTEQLMEASSACSSTAAELLARPGGPALVGFGAGPLLPRGPTSTRRVELVLPHRLHHQ
ncbi:MAG TPA: DUF4892 domain-containing protein [Pseudomonadales bacterium]